MDDSGRARLRFIDFRGITEMTANFKGDIKAKFNTTNTKEATDMDDKTLFAKMKAIFNQKRIQLSMTQIRAEIETEFEAKH